MPVAHEVVHEPEEKLAPAGHESHEELPAALHVKQDASQARQVEPERYLPEGQDATHEPSS